MESNQKPSLIKDLWDRRVFQFFATYLGASWALIQFTEWLVKRYSFEDGLVDKIALFLLICLPAFLIFVYNHGRPGPDEWKPFEKVFIPINLVIAAALSFFIISPKAAPKTEVVSIQTEEGDTITRIIPSAALTNRFVIFPFENKSGNSEKDWLRLGIPLLLDKDLEQDMRVFVLNPLDLKSGYKALKKLQTEDISFSPKLKMAKDNYADFFITGDFNIDNNQYKLNVEVFDANNGRSFFANQFEGDSYYDVVDLLTKDLMDNVYLEEFEIGETIVDLPATDLISSVPEAFEKYTDGIFFFNDSINKPEQAEVYFNQAVELDPDCALCYSSRAHTKRIRVQLAEAEEDYKTAMALAQSLPERQRMNIQQYYYFTRHEPDKAAMLLETWIKLYPNDYTPYSSLLNYYSLVRDWSKAKEIGEKAIQNGHQGSIYKRLASLYSQTRDFDKALKYFEKFAQLYPHKAYEISELANIYYKKGEFQKAREHLENIALRNPHELEYQLSLASFEEKRGNIETAEQMFFNSFKYALSKQDTAQIYWSIERFYERFGQISKTFEIQEQRFELLKTYLPQISVDLDPIFGWIQCGNRYPLIDRIEEYRELTEELISRYEENNPVIACLAEVLYNMQIENNEEFLKYYQECKELFLRSSANMTYMFDGMQKKFEGDYEAARGFFKQYIDSTGVTEAQFGHMMSEVTRLSGNIEEARKSIDYILQDDPENPIFLLELAKVEFAENNNGDATKTLEKVFNYWRYADENFKYLLEAQELKNSLEKL